MASLEETYSFPAQDASPPWFPVQKAGFRIQEFAVLASRWPARDLEKWERQLSGINSQEAGRQLWKQLEKRRRMHIGGVDLRIVQLVYARDSR